MSSTYRCSCGARFGVIQDPWVCESGHAFLMVHASQDHGIVTAFDEYGRKRQFAPETVTGRRMKAIPALIPADTPTSSPTLPPT